MHIIFNSEISKHNHIQSKTSLPWSEYSFVTKYDTSMIFMT